MRQSALGVWIFTNLLFFGLCGYMYLIWSQYWLYNERQKRLVKPTDQSIPYLKILNEPIDLNLERADEKNKTPPNATFTTTRIFKRDTKQVSGKPRFPSVHTPLIDFDSKKYQCREPKTSECTSKTEIFKNLMEKELHRVLYDESHVFKSGIPSQNIYNVTFDVTKTINKPTPRAVTCALKNVRFKTVKRNEKRFPSNDFRNFIPEKPLLNGRTFNRCAVVTNSGALLGSKLGQFIDSHDLVLRFNSAPTEKFAEDVGVKTTLRVVNSQVVSKQEFDFLNSNLYKDTSLLAWDPSNYSASLNDWFLRPDHQIFIRFKKFMLQSPSADFHLLDPSVLWSLWEMLQSFSPYRIRKNPPSSGFLGLWFCLEICDRVSVMEYIPSVRVTHRCHYWEDSVADGRACTLGAWHPLAQEKIIAMMLAENDGQIDSFEVFQRGILQIQGFKHASC